MEETKGEATTQGAAAYGVNRKRSTMPENVSAAEGQAAEEEKKEEEIDHTDGKNSPTDTRIVDKQ